MGWIQYIESNKFEENARWALCRSDKIYLNGS